MARGEMVRKVALVVVFYCLVVQPSRLAEGQVSCPLVVTSLLPCATYLTSGGPISRRCCSGVRSLQKAASTTDDRQTACQCMEQAAAIFPGINIYNARSLPAKCNVDVAYDINPDTDCSKYLLLNMDYSSIY
ncbi:hypothetical protein L2E82_11480 [Cichorium intybus]|uniref:Uncharacterized protein n=1 Tax=Cichorium intybus TaxID=13427 RepID=A0ACB9GEG7_CICIN|nr:hypothetical protein L2E82_11480 [Cichorium intybus]